MNQRYTQAIKNVAIVYRPGLPEAKKVALELADWLKAKKIKVFSHPKRKIGTGKNAFPVVKNLKTLDLVIVLGGDGTYLEAVRMLEGKKVPILGVNLGSLGFLTENPREDLYKVLTLTLDGKMEMRPRSLLRVKVKLKNKIVKDINALNDIVIERGSRSHLISLKLGCDNMSVSEVKADGVIIASPTGSTAYNLAAGGPILHPEVAAYVVTPICPHSLTNRPIIFPDNKKLCLQLTHHHNATLTVDGKAILEINNHHQVVVESCKQTHFVLKKPTHNYFDLLNKKLKFGER